MEEALWSHTTISKQAMLKVTGLWLHRTIKTEKIYESRSKKNFTYFLKYCLHSMLVSAVAKKAGNALLLLCCKCITYLRTIFAE